MQDHRHRPSVKLSTRRQNELAAARRCLHASLTDSQLALDTAARRLAMHARRSLTSPAALPTIHIFCPSLDGPEIPACDGELLAHHATA